MYKRFIIAWVLFCAPSVKGEARCDTYSKYDFVPVFKAVLALSGIETQSYQEMRCRQQYETRSQYDAVDKFYSSSSEADSIYRDKAEPLSSLSMHDSDYRPGSLEFGVLTGSSNSKPKSSFETAGGFESTGPLSD